MKRSAVAFIVGLVLWVVVASLLNRGLRIGFAGYAAAEPTMAFTLGMKLGRLMVGALASLSGRRGRRDPNTLQDPAMGARHHSPGRIYPRSHPALGQVSGLVSHRFLRNAGAAGGTRCSICSEPLEHPSGRHQGLGKQSP